jgi:hypothetical protein
MFVDDKGHPGFEAFDPPAILFTGLVLVLLYFLAFKRVAAPKTPAQD